MEKQKLLSPKKDVVFQCLFGKQSNESITRNLISKVLGKEIGELDLEKNTKLIPEYPNEKYGVVDVRAVEKESKINYEIEMQMCSMKELPDRILYYWSRLYAGQLEKGKLYKTLKPTIVIMLINEEMGQLKDLKESHTQWHIREDKNKEIILTENLEIHIIEIQKYLKNTKVDKKDELRNWIEFLDNPESGGEMVSNEEIEKAREELARISADKELMRMIELREKWEHDEATLIDNAREEGLEKGLEEGLEKGLEEGKRDAQTEIIIAMLKKGIKHSEIAEITKAELEEIEQIAKDVK